MATLKSWGGVLLLALGLFVPSFQETVINTTECGDGSTTNWATWAQWSALGDCSVTCASSTGEQTRERSRTCPVRVMMCDAEQIEREFYECTGSSQTVNGDFGHWTHWENRGGCSVLCGTGKQAQKRTRSCDSPPPSCGGSDCTGSDVERRPVSCYPGSCGSTCSLFSAPTVLSYKVSGGTYLLCLQGSIAVQQCPGPYDVSGYFKVPGYTNAVRMYRICNYQ